MEISDEVVGHFMSVFNENGKGTYIHGPADRESVRDALQDVIPLVVEGLVGPEKKHEGKHVPPLMHAMDAAHNLLRQDILAKVKK